MTGQPISYRIVYSRRRSIGIIVTPDQEVIVRAPFRTSQAAIGKFVASKSAWIRKHLESYSKITRIDHSDIYDGRMILFRGEECILRIRQSTVSSVIIAGPEIVIYTNDLNNKILIASELGKWYKKNATENFTAIMDRLLKRFAGLDFSPAGLSLRTMKRRWGSCSDKGKITLNTELIKLDDRFTEYVILHELCHLKQHNHGREFYALLSLVCPQWKETRKELRKFIV